MGGGDHIAVGIRTNGYREVLGMWLGKNETSAYWLSVLTESSTQICVVHQIGNSMRYVVWKNRKE